MKKLLALGIAILTMTTSVFAGTDVNVKVNDKEIEAKGVIVDGRTLVPVRGIFEELGYFVVYNAETKTAFLNSLGSTIKMTIQQRRLRRMTSLACAFVFVPTRKFVLRLTEAPAPKDLASKTWIASMTNFLQKVVARRHLMEE